VKLLPGKFLAGVMATENIVMLACAGVLCTLHVLGGPLSGLFRSPASKRRGRRDAPADDDETGSMANAE
jgi:hypothetical protein